MSEPSFRRNVENKKVMAVMDGQVHRFRESEIRRYAMEVRRERIIEGVLEPEDIGELTAIIFELLDEGVHPADVVKRLRKPAKVVEEIHAQWVRMRGIFVVNGAQAAELNALDWTGFGGPGDPAQSGETLVHRIRELHKAHEYDARGCVRCKAARPAVCAACYRLHPEEIKARTRRYVEEAKTERAHYAGMRAPGRASQKSAAE